MKGIPVELLYQSNIAARECKIIGGFIINNKKRGEMD